MEHEQTARAIRGDLEKDCGPTVVTVSEDSITIVVTPKDGISGGSAFSLSSWLYKYSSRTGYRYTVGAGYEFHSMIVTTDTYTYVFTKKRT